MKYLILTITCLIILIAVITNPNQDRHREVVKNKINFYMQKNLSETNGLELLGAMLGGAVVNVVINNLVSTDNYVLFSTTKINWRGESKVIGVGVFGNVYITSELVKAMEKGLLNEQIEQIDREVELPSFIGVNIKELLNNETVSKDYIIVVSDYLYDRERPPRIVLKQDPHEGEMVKKGRKVYVTVASDTPPKVIMPQLQDVSLRQTEIMLKAIGLALGTIIYKHSPHENVVLEQLYQGRIITPGTEINAGETITLVVGKKSIETEIVE